MRLSGWRAVAPRQESMAPKVVAVVEPVLTALGAEPDPHAWVFWGDDPDIRYLVAVVTAPGLITCNVRVNVPGEGPRVSAKLVRWSRVQVGDLAIETAPGGHMILGAQVEGNVFRATDDAVPDAAGFMLAVLAGMDGRPLPDLGTEAASGTGSAEIAPRGSARAAAAKRTARGG